MGQFAIPFAYTNAQEAMQNLLELIILQVPIATMLR